MAKGKVGGAKGRMITAGGMGGANPTGSIANTDGYQSFQQSRNNGKGGAEGKSSGARARMSVAGNMGGATAGKSVVPVDGIPGGGKEIGRTCTPMGPTAESPKGQYADRMRVAGGFGGSTGNKGIN